MTTDTSPVAIPRTESARALGWRAHAALFAMALTSFSLVGAEFLPGGLLTLMAEDLGVTAGQAGQTVTATAIAGFIAAPLVGVLTPGLDRKRLLVGLAIAAALSNLLVALAPSLPVLLASRALLGAALSGFWSMSLTVAARIGGADRMAKSMLVVNGGTTIATVVGVPLGVLVGALAGWRGVFIAAAVLTLLAALALTVLVPAVPAERGTTLTTLWQTMLEPGMRAGLAGHVLIVLGHMAAYAFARVALERAALDAGGVAALLLVFGIGGFLGNLVIGAVADRRLSLLQFGVPGAMALSILALALWPQQLPIVAIAVAVWGFTLGGWLVVIVTWAGRQAPHRLEAGGGLVVTGFQLAIALGAAIGGLLVDLAGIGTELIVAAAAVAVGMVLFGTARVRRT